MFRRMRLRLLFALVCLAAAAATAQVKPSPYEKTVSAFEAADRSNSPPKNALLFAGSSSISMWKTLARDFAEYRVINRGISGSHIADAVKFLDHSRRVVVVPPFGAAPLCQHLIGFGRKGFGRGFGHLVKSPFGLEGDINRLPGRRRVRDGRGKQLQGHLADRSSAAL